MNFSKHLRETVQSGACLTAIVFLTSCGGSKQFGFEEEIKEHFGDMNYAEIIISENIDFDADSELTAFKGKVTRADENGNPVNFSWLYVEDANGETGGFYWGFDDLKSTGIAQMTKGEHDTIYRHCKTLGDSAKRDCIHTLGMAKRRDCLILGRESKEQCETHCWYQIDPDYCGDLHN